MTLKPSIEVKNVSKSFRNWTNRPDSAKTLLVDLFKNKIDFKNRKKFLVLDSISFTIMPGEFVGIMGRNGAGKSTLLKLIAGIYTPTSGKIEINGKIAPLIELGAGFDGNLSGYENIFLNAAILGFGRKETNGMLSQIIEFSELGEHIFLPVKNYSSGMAVRLGFSIATHLTAPILLIDEILAVGDIGFQKKSLKKIKALHEEGRTLILITHDPQSIQEHCERCIVIEQTKKVYDGPATEGSAFYLKTFT